MISVGYAHPAVKLFQHYTAYNNATYWHLYDIFSLISWTSLNIGQPIASFRNIKLHTLINMSLWYNKQALSKNKHFWIALLLWVYLYLNMYGWITWRNVPGDILYEINVVTGHSWNVKPDKKNYQMSDYQML